MRIIPFRKRKPRQDVGAWDQWRVFPRCIPYIRPFRKLVLVILLFTVLSAIVGLAEPWPLALVIDNVLGSSSPPGPLNPLFGDNPDPYRLLVFIVAFGFLISILSHGLRIINDYVSAKVEQNLVLNLRSDLF